MEKRNLNLFFLFVILLSFVIVNSNLGSSAPPSGISGTTTEGLDIGLLETEGFKQNQPHTIKFHVYNSSNGVPITSGVTCYLHFYNSSGHHLFEGVNTTPVHQFDYEFKINAQNFSAMGEHRFIGQCNSSSQGGFRESYIMVTPTGRDKVAVFQIIFILLVAGIMLLGIYKGDITITMLGTFGLYFVAFYLMFYGIDTFKNSYTDVISIIMLGVAFYVSTKIAHEYIV